MNAIICVCIGDNYLKCSHLTRRSISEYAKRIGAKFILHTKSRVTYPHYEKLILDEYLDFYDRILVVDLDLLISPRSPNIFDIVPEDKFGIFDENVVSNELEKAIHHEIMEKAKREHKLRHDRSSCYNSGVFLFSRCHKKIFRSFREVFMENMDQPLLNLWLQDVDVYDIGYTFNHMPFIDKHVKKSRLESNFIHYAGLNNFSEVAVRDWNYLNGLPYSP